MNLQSGQGSVGWLISASCGWRVENQLSEWLTLCGGRQLQANEQECSWGYRLGALMLSLEPLCELLGFPAGKGWAILRKQEGNVWHFYDVVSKSHKHHLCRPLLDAPPQCSFSLSPFFLSLKSTIIAGWGSHKIMLGGPNIIWEALQKMVKTSETLTLASVEEANTMRSTVART